MKKRTSLVILTLSAGFLLAACGEQAPAVSSSPAPAASSSPAVGNKVTVTFNTNGGSAVAAQEIEKGGKATKPADPTKMGATFVNWYADEVLATEFDFDEAINANTTVYAKWQEAATPDSSSEGEPAEEDDKLYFKDVSWWNNMGAYTVAQFDEGIPTKMIPATVYDPVGKFNVWSIDIPAEAATVTFYRSYDDPDHDVTMDLNGPKTVAVTLADAGDHNMYDISGVASYDWDHPADVTGVWGDFEGGSDPVTPPSEDSSGGAPVTPSGDTLSITITGMPNWVANANAAVFAWSWGGGDGAWTAVTLGNPGNGGADAKELSGTVELPAGRTGFNLARCVAGTTAPDWNATGDNAGRVYNKTGDITIVAGTTSYESPNWVAYNK